MVADPIAVARAPFSLAEEESRRLETNGEPAWTPAETADGSIRRAKLCSREEDRYCLVVTRGRSGLSRTKKMKRRNREFLVCAGGSLGQEHRSGADNGLWLSGDELQRCN